MHSEKLTKTATKTVLKTPPTVLILASGRGERFFASGGTTHKLQALLGDKSVLQHTVDAVIASGLPYHVENAGHPGMGDSIAAAVKNTQNANGWLVLPADLPLVQPETLLQVAEALHSNDVVQPVFVQVNEQSGEHSSEQLSGHPVGFARGCLDKLLKLEGNKGAAGVLIAYNAIKLMVKDVGIITDIDTVEDLTRAELILKNRQRLAL
jgi:molybdenum cofactor cytidylyltransferase